MFPLRLPTLADGLDGGSAWDSKEPWPRLRACTGMCPLGPPTPDPGSLLAMLLTGAAQMSRLRPASTESNFTGDAHREALFLPVSC